MQLYGKSDKNFGDMGDFTGKVYVPLDFNTVVPLLQRKPTKCFSICEDSFEKLLGIFKKKLTKTDSRGDLLVLMRVKQNKTMNSKSISAVGWKISSLMSKHSLVVWSAQEYKTYRFDFYFYEQPKHKVKRTEYSLENLNSKGHSIVKVKCVKCGKEHETVIENVDKKRALKSDIFICEKCGLK